MESPASIRQFWFGDDADDRVTSERQAALWWSKNEAADRMIRQRFEAPLAAAADGRLDAWADSAEGLLALILLTDQFPRSMYRDDARAFAFDPLARRWCRLALQRQADAALRPIERVFVYLPLEHSEAQDDQRQALELFGALLRQAPPELRDVYAGYFDFAQRHHDIIERFGRFPHRNAILGRTSTPQETAFLQQPGSSF